MDLKRRGVRGKQRASYPSAADVRSQRRRFLKLVGVGLLGGSVLGLAACTEKAGKEAIDADEWALGGTDLSADLPHDEWVLGGYEVAPELNSEVGDVVSDAGSDSGTGTEAPDLQTGYEEDWTVAGG
jgi:hypothetical protein